MTLSLTAIQARLKDLPENEFSRKVLVPLMSAMGYDKVEFFGGVDEEGKDVIGWKRDETGLRPWLGVMQAKKTKITRRAADKNSFVEIVNQLIQCTEKRLPHTDGNTYLPDVVYFVTPLTIDTKVLESRIEKVAALSNKVRILEGADLCSLLLRKVPDVIDRILGTNIDISRAIEKTLTNKQLLSALKVGKEQHVNSFYIDIDLQIGRDTTHEFLRIKPNPTQLRYELSATEWAAFLEFNRRCTEALSVQTIDGSVADTERARARRLEALDQWTHQESTKRSQVQRARKAAADARDEFTEALNRIRAAPQYRALQQQLNKLPIPKKPDERDPKREALGKRLHALEAPATKLEERARNLQSTYDIALAEYDLLTQNKPPETYPVTADGRALSSAMMKVQADIAAQIASHNKTLPTVDQLRTFLETCGVLSSRLQGVLSSKFATELLQLGENGFQVPSGGANERLCVPLDRLIDTGIHLSVFGDAGAGKTTSLQHYSWKALSADGGRMALYVPLSRMVRTAPYRALSGASEVRLQDGLVAYLSELGVSIDADALLESLNQRRGTLLLDGIDEAIGQYPGLLRSVREFAETFPRVQIVTSSRIEGRALKDHAFLGVTLLPFSDAQRQKFVADWFGGSADIATRIERHCARTRSLAEVVRTPLNATILCVLAERGLRLPRSETQLYQSRLELLLSEYDLHKGIQRVRSDRIVLETIAKKLAYWLHVEGRREASREDLVKVARDAGTRTLTSMAMEAVEELISPCNVLVPMTEDGRFGFGHLRYQEFLVALELMTNRSTDVPSRLAKTWWHGPLRLMAEMSDSLRWLLDSVVREDAMAGNEGILLDMVRVGPRRDRAESAQLIKDYSNVGRMDSAVGIGAEDWSELD